MTGRELKALVATLADDVEVFVAGPDSGGYDWIACERAEITPMEGPEDVEDFPEGAMLLAGVCRD